VDRLMRGEHTRVSIGVTKRPAHLKLTRNSSKGARQGTVHQAFGNVITVQWVLAKGA
jgi:hypothetical protein